MTQTRFRSHVWRRRWRIGIALCVGLIASVDAAGLPAWQGWCTQWPTTPSAGPVPTEWEVPVPDELQAHSDEKWVRWAVWREVDVWADVSRTTRSSMLFLCAVDLDAIVTRTGFPMRSTQRVECSSFWDGDYAHWSDSAWTTFPDPRLSIFSDKRYIPGTWHWLPALANWVIWSIATYVLLMPLFRWRDRRLRHRHCCTHCKYDLRGAVRDAEGGITCPECGRTAAARVDLTHENRLS